MEAALPTGRIKVKSIVPNAPVKFMHDAQKEEKIKKLKDAKLQAKYEARKQAREAKIAQKNAIAEQALKDRVRKKMIAEAYSQMGIPIEYIEQQKKVIEEMQKNLPDFSKMTPQQRYQYQMNITKGLAGSAGADKKEIRNTAISAGMDGARAVAGGVLDVIQNFSGALMAIPFVGPAFYGISALLGLRKCFKKNKMRNGNLADEAKNLEEAKVMLAELETQLKAVSEKLIADHEMMLNKYKTMKRSEFNAELKTYITKLLSDKGLINSVNKEQVEETLKNDMEAVAGVAGQESQVKSDEPEAAQEEGDKNAEIVKNTEPEAAQKESKESAEAENVEAVKEDIPQGAVVEEAQIVEEEPVKPNQAEAATNEQAKPTEEGSVQKISAAELEAAKQEIEREQVTIEATVPNYETSSKEQPLTQEQLKQQAEQNEQMGGM